MASRIGGLAVAVVAQEDVAAGRRGGARREVAKPVDRQLGDADAGSRRGKRIGSGCSDAHRHDDADEVVAADGSIIPGSSSPERSRATSSEVRALSTSMRYLLLKPMVTSGPWSEASISSLPAPISGFSLVMTHARGVHGELDAAGAVGGHEGHRAQGVEEGGRFRRSPCGRWPRGSPARRRGRPRRRAWTRGSSLALEEHRALRAGGADAHGERAAPSSFFSARTSSTRRLSSWTALAGMSSLLWPFMPLILRSALESRWPSVVTMRRVSPAISKSAAERCGRVSSVDIEN
jgi:hypothetical protein